MGERVKITNEEIVIAIQCGDVSRYAELWDNCHKLLYMILDRYLQKITLPNYIDNEDLKQCLFFALRTAVNSYNKDKPFLFNSYLRYSVINTVKNQLPGKSVEEISLNQPANISEDESTEIGDLIEDENAAVCYKNIEHTELADKVLSAIKQLPELQSICIKKSFYDKMNYQQIADQIGESVDTVRKSIAIGLYTLQRNKSL